MKKESLTVGRVVRSRSGRDAGRRFIVVAELDDNYVTIADGGLRKIEKPKKKKRKHLDAIGEVHASMRSRLRSGELVENHELRKALAGDDPKEE